MSVKHCVMFNENTERGRKEINPITEISLSY